MLRDELIGVILVGGTGSRLSPITLETCKPCIPLNEITTLEYQIKLLRSNLCTRIALISSSYSYGLHDLVNSISDRSNINIYEESDLLGTAGGLVYFLPYILQDSLGYCLEQSDSVKFIVLNGDILTNIPVFPMLSQLKNGFSAVILATLMADASPYGLLDISNNRVNCFKEKEKNSSGYINAGVYVLEASLLRQYESGRCLMFEYDIFPDLARRGELGTVISDEPWVDTGTRLGFLKGLQYINSNEEPVSAILPGACVHKSSIIVDSIIGFNTIIGKNTKITNCIIGNRCKILDDTILDNEQISNETTI